MINYLKWLAILIFIKGSFIFYAQDYCYRHYTVEDGLPSSEVYSAFQDSKGYLWFATDAGVSRFDGYEFQNFDVSNGLTDNTVFLITEDHRGRIWFGTFNCRLSYYENGHIYPFKYNDQLSQYIQGTLDIKSFFVDKHDNIWMGFNYNGIYKCSSTGKVEQLLTLPDSVSSLIKTYQVNDQVFISGIKAHLSADLNEKIIIETSIKNKEFQLYHEIDSFPNRMIKITPVYFNKGTLLQYGGNWFYLDLKTEKLQALIPSFNPLSTVYNVMASKGYLWISTEKKGVYKCKIQNDSIIVINQFLDGKSVSRTYLDSEGGIWFQTLQEGVYYLPSENIRYKYAPEHTIISLEADTVSGKIFLGTFEGRILALTSENGEIRFETIAENADKVFDLTYDYINQRLYYCGAKNGGYLSYWKDNQSFVMKNCPLGGSCKNIVINKDSILYGDTYGFGIITNDQTIYSSQKKGGPKIWCSSLIADGNKHIWIGTKDGLRIFKNNEITTPFSDPALSSSITCIKKMNHDTFLIGTKSFGVIIIRENKIYDIIDQTDGLVGNLVRTIHIDDKNTIWVGTNRGISKVDFTNLKLTQISNLTEKQGLVTHEINDITSYKHTIYVATPKGLIYFDRRNILPKQKDTPIHITSFKVNRAEQILLTNNALEHDENDIEISFIGFNYNSLGEINYQYRLLGVDSNWSYTKQKTINYPALQPGRYTFEVMASNEYGFWGTPSRLTFTISPPFWATWWFRLSILSIIIALIYISFKVNVLAYNKHVQQEILKRILKKLGRQSYILIEADKQKTRIKENDILYIEAFKNYVEINTTDKKYVYRSTMKNMEEKLSSINFIRIHRSYIVQKEKIDSISENHLLINKAQIPIGKTYQKKLRELNQHFFTINS